MIFKSSAANTMQLRFFALDVDACLKSFCDLEAIGSFAEVVQQVEGQFETMVKTLEIAQVMVLCTSLGDPPGCVVAAEAIYMAHLNRKFKPDNCVRTLVWLVEDYIPKH